eukprot:scaffold13491_cov154-Skeletonema_marinoi.AAC.4
MEQRPNHAVLKDAQTMLSEEEYVTGMGRRKKSAAVKDARCTNQVQRGGVCKKHGAKVKL